MKNNLMKMRKIWDSTKPKNKQMDKTVIWVTILYTITSLSIGIFYPPFIMKVMIANTLILLIIIIYNVYLLIRK